MWLGSRFDEPAEEVVVAAVAQAPVQLQVSLPVQWATAEAIAAEAIAAEAIAAEAAAPAVAEGTPAASRGGTPTNSAEAKPQAPITNASSQANAVPNQWGITGAWVSNTTSISQVLLPKLCWSPWICQWPKCSYLWELSFSC